MPHRSHDPLGISDTELTAFHEAGHVIAGIALGGLLDCVIVNGGTARASWVGYTGWLNFEGPYTGFAVPDWPFSENMTADLVCTVAGPIAETMAPTLRRKPAIRKRLPLSARIREDGWYEPEVEEDEIPCDAAQLYSLVCRIVRHEEVTIEEALPLIDKAETWARMILNHNKLRLSKLANALVQRLGKYVSDTWVKRHIGTPKIPPRIKAELSTTHKWTC
jgi:hypothetical protein